MIQKDYIERCYAGWLGKTIGVRLGSCVEGWTMERIRKTYGNIEGYLMEYDDYASDDDLNGPVYYLRALNDYGLKPTAEQMGRTILNYVPYEHSFFWWGGYGISTEHTAYLNLRAGIPAPRSGSIRQNGRTVAEQIGGQIFSDAWGLINPGNPQRAAEYAQLASSVTHDGNGVYGARFVAACIAAAFTCTSIEEMILEGLRQIPSDSEYANLVSDIMMFWREHRENWELCWQYVYANYGYDRYGGNCHILPNTAVMILSLLYGEGDFDRTLCICTMCGWDTDCNAGNVGTMIGVFCGLEQIDAKWTEPIHDLLVGSSVIGSLNITDLPQCVVAMAQYAYQLEQQPYPEVWKTVLEQTCAKVHFELPRSTHSVRLSAKGTIRNTDAQAHTGRRSILVAAQETQKIAASLKTYYQPADFTDNRYQPSFSPVFYPGQSVVMWLRAAEGRHDLKAHLWIKDCRENVLLTSKPVMLTDSSWTPLNLKADVPDDCLIHEVGVAVEGDAAPAFYLDDIDFMGYARYRIEFSHLQMEDWAGNQHEVPQCTYLRGIWTLEDGMLSGSGTTPCEAYTGDDRFEDVSVCCDFIPVAGACFRVLIRVQGAERCYAATLYPDRLCIEKKDGSFTALAHTPFQWKNGEAIRLQLSAQGDQISICIGDTWLQARDDAYTHGCLGWGLENGRMLIRETRIEEFAPRA